MMEAAETGPSKVLKLCVKNNPPDLSSNEQEENSRCDLATWLLFSSDPPSKLVVSPNPFLGTTHFTFKFYLLYISVGSAVVGVFNAWSFWVHKMVFSFVLF